MMTEVQCGIVW